MFSRVSEKPLILIGGGGHALSVLDVLQEAGARQEVAGYLSLNRERAPLSKHLPQLGTDAFLDSPDAPSYCYLVAFGSIKRLAARATLADKLDSRGWLAPSLVSPRASVASSARIQDGAIVFRNSVLNVDVEVGPNAHVNTGAIVEHGTVIGRNSSISPGAIIAGGCTLGSNVFIGAGAVVLNDISIADNSVVGAGRVVKHNVNSGITLR